VVYFQVVKVVIEMSLGLYDSFLGKCNQSSQGYALLKNGVIVRRSKDDHYERIIEIHCGMEQSKSLLDLAKQIYSDAVPAIEKLLVSHARVRSVASAYPIHI
jgi:hypothetical protein